ncbi:MAG: fermentation-respiration switch protein FrsA (DUF1100 family) [Pirellulaceae bacterium]|jgi:fermentation-respiration switch protein FrsA (DUF1100 family)
MKSGAKSIFKRDAERSTIRKMLLKYLIVAIVIYAAILLLLVIFETSIIYPAPKYPAGNWVASRHGATDVEFESADGTKLHAWYYEQDGARGTLLFCHGNGEHVGYNGPYGALLSRELNLNVLVFDYRGYGRSEGSPAKDGILADGEAAIKWLAEKNGVTPGQVIVYGRSLGGAVACHLGAKHQVKGLFLQSTFSRMGDVAAGKYPIFPVKLLMRNRYDSVEYVRQYQNPLIHIHGDQDTVVPIHYGEVLFNAAASADKRFVRLSGLGHNNVSERVALNYLQPFVDNVFDPQE